MTESASANVNTPATAPSIALYLGESYATLGVFDNSLSAPAKTSAFVFEKSVYLPQTSLKNLLAQTVAANPELKIESIFIVTRYLDRLQTFRLGGSVIQAVPAGFENSYSVAQTQMQSLAAPALILTIPADLTADALELQLASELARLKKLNSEINKVVLQLPASLFTLEQIETVKKFFVINSFKVFNVPDPFDSESVRRTLLNAGSEGTKDEILADIRSALGSDVKINFWVNNCFSEVFENIDLYFSSHNFLHSYLLRENLTQGFYFDVENWSAFTVATHEKWHSPWGTIQYTKPNTEKFSMSPFCELTINVAGQVVVASATPQFEPGPIVAGRSVKTLILDVFSEELRDNKLISNLFPQLMSDTIQQKVNTQFQILQKAQSLDLTRMSKTDIKEWLRFSVTAWILKQCSSGSARILGDFGSFFFQDLKKHVAFSYSNYNWPQEIMLQAKKGSSLELS